eukprot:5053348-Pyramimonas_sp.AAC.1
MCRAGGGGDPAVQIGFGGGPMDAVGEGGSGVPKVECSRRKWQTARGGGVWAALHRAAGADPSAPEGAPRQHSDGTTHIETYHTDKVRAAPLKDVC